MPKCIDSTISGKNLEYDDLEWIRNNAIEFGLKGITFFKSDGSIKIIAEGEEKKLLSFIKKIKQGRYFFSFFSGVENFSITWQSAKNEFENFSITD